MRTLLLSLLMMCLASAGRASASETILLVQPILAQGDAGRWGDDGYRITDLPYLSWDSRGGPPYQAISQSNRILTDAPRQARQGEGNLLALYNIRVSHRDPRTNEVWLYLDEAQAIRGWPASVEDAAHAALECIRILSFRYQIRPQVRIVGPRGSEKAWDDVAGRFNRHDFSKPFPRRSRR